MSANISADALGPPKPRCRDEPITVSLEELAPKGIFSMHLEAKRDLGVIRDWTWELDAERGRPAIDPVVVFTVQLGDVLRGHPRQSFCA